MIQTAIETISDGFVLFDPDDRLVLCNSRFRELYPKLADVAQPGAPFSSILEVGVARGVLDTGGKSGEAMGRRAFAATQQAGRSGRISPWR